MYTKQADDPDFHGDVQAVLEAWRRHERELADLPRGSADRDRAEAEVARLRSDYQQLIEQRIREGRTP